MVTSFLLKDEQIQGLGTAVILSQGDGWQIYNTKEVIKLLFNNKIINLVVVGPTVY